MFPNDHLPVIEETHYRITDSQRHGFISACKASGEYLACLGQCTGYEVVESYEDPERFILRISWRSMDLCRVFRELTFHPAWKLGQFVNEAESLRRYRPTDVCDSAVAIRYQLSDKGLYSTSVDKSSTVFADFKGWILRHIHEPISVERMAVQTNMSPRNFARVFRKEFHTSPGAFVESVRIEVAMALLNRTTLKVREVATAVGLRNPTTLRRMFVRSLGECPNRLRSHDLEEDQDRFASRRIRVTRKLDGTGHGTILSIVGTEQIARNYPT